MPWEAPPQTYLSGNTAGTTHVFGPVVTLQGSNITLSGSGNKIVLIGPVGATQTVAGSAAISAGTQSVSTGTIKFADSNGITFGMSDSSQITATVKTDYLTAQSAFVLSNSNGVSWGTNASTVTATVKTAYVGLNTAKSNATWTVNSSGVSLDASGYAGTGTAATNAGLTVDSGGVSVSVAAQSVVPGHGLGVSNTGNTAGNTGTGSTGTVVFAASGGLTASQSTGAGISTVWYSVGPYITTARASTDAVGLNTAQTAVTWTVNSSGISFDAGAYLTTARRSTDAVGLNTAKTAVTWTVNSSGISFDAGAYLTTARASTDAIGLNTAKTAVTWTVNSSGLSLDAGAYLTTARASTDAIGLNTAQTNVTWTVNSSGLSLNAGGYAGTVTGATNASITVNTAGVSVSVKAPSVSYWENPRVDGLASWSGTSNSISIQRILVPFQISATRADFLLNISGSSSGALSVRVNLGLYTGANSTLNSASTTSRGFTFQSTSAQSYTNWSGPRSVSIGLGTWNLTPGEYFLAANFGWTTASTNTVSLNMYGNSSFAVSGAESGALGNFTNFFRSGMINNNAQSTLPDTMQLSGMTQTGGSAAQQPWFGFHGTF